ncbi:MAG: hypothetical protein SFW08_06325 [Gemmatimonadaceae bacterium]|nr:hypothetical protein [Gemmatimonadaceae bacterium]
MTRRWAAITVAAWLAAAPVLAQETTTVPERSDVEFGAPLILGNVIGTLTLTTLDHLLRSPEAWPQNGSGYAQRLGVRSVQFLASATVESGLAAVWNDRLGYTPCRCDGAARRSSHVLWQSLTVGRRGGRRRFAWPIVIGALAGGAASAPLLPPSDRWVWTLSRPATTLLTRALLNGVRELAR